MARACDLEAFSTENCRKRREFPTDPAKLDARTSIWSLERSNFVEKWDEIGNFLENLDDRVALAVLDVILEGRRVRKAARRWKIGEFRVYEALRDLATVLEEV
jgi:hypothetical protein